jgi:nucleotide-binding universal stress UspA family protein
MKSVDLQACFKEFHINMKEVACARAVKEQPEIEVKTCLEKGLPSDVIMKVAKIENVDLIVLGSRGLGGITVTILGSTSQSVVHSCTRPILIVK